MERIHMHHMPIAGKKPLSGYKLSHIIAKLKFEKVNERGQFRGDKTKKAVLRALCDRYPDVWPGIEDIAANASCSTAQARRVLRELEYKDRLIVDVNSRLTWHRSSDGRGWELHTEDVGKRGGRRKDRTPPDFICDRQIY